MNSWMASNISIKYLGIHHGLFTPPGTSTLAFERNFRMNISRAFLFRTIELDFERLSSVRMEGIKSVEPPQPSICIWRIFGQYVSILSTLLCWRKSIRSKKENEGVYFYPCRSSRCSNRELYCLEHGIQMASDKTIGGGVVMIRLTLSSAKRDGCWKACAESVFCWLGAHRRRRSQDRNISLTFSSWTINHWLKSLVKKMLRIITLVVIIHYTVGKEIIDF